MTALLLRKGIQIVLAQLAIICVVFSTEAHAAKESVKQEPGLYKASVFWPKVAEASRISFSRRRKFIEQLHTIQAKGGLSPQEEAVLLGGLAVLHCTSSDSRYAAPSLIAEARRKWPQLVGFKETGMLWEAFLGCYNKRNNLDEAALEQIASSFEGFLPIPETSSQFAFYRALRLSNAGKPREALKYLAEISVDSEHYRRAKFVEGLALIEQSKFADARESLQVVISLDPTRSEQRANISNSTIQRLRELAVLNVARMLYEQGEFQESLAYYRTLTQDSHFFYESLYEQGWAFFMAGYPNRALGAEYAATTPFFQNKFNPDSYFLSAVVHFWMCNFEESHKGVQRFINHTRKEGDELRSLVGRYNAMAFQDGVTRYASIVEESMRGVSASNLGVGPKVLATLRAKDFIEEMAKSLVDLQKGRKRLQQRNDASPGKDAIIAAYNTFEDAMRSRLGAAVKRELTVMAVDFEKSLTQSRLLYLEILTAKKDSVLGKQRTVSGGEYIGFEREFNDIAAQSSHAWRQDKSEFWFDELGHYVFEGKSQCGVPKAQGAAPSKRTRN